MKAMVITQPCEVETDGMERKLPYMHLKRDPLTLQELPVPNPCSGEVRIKVTACGVCHTELDEIEGRKKIIEPVVPGHEVVGRVDALGKNAVRHKIGDRVGVAWISSSCGKCSRCRSGRENLCGSFIGTGCETNGGYAEYMTVKEEYAYPIPEVFNDFQAAPLLCAGAVGWRALKLTEVKNGDILGLFGFGASAHIVIQVSRSIYPDCPVYVFTRSPHHRELAKKLGAAWTGGMDDLPPRLLNRAIDFTPVGETVAHALGMMEPGGRLTINAIRKRTLVMLDYSLHLWHEREIKSTANITRRDVEEFLPLAAKIPIIPEIQEFPLEEANQALRLLKQGKIQGAAVLRIS